MRRFHCCVSKRSSSQPLRPRVRILEMRGMKRTREDGNGGVEGEAPIRRGKDRREVGHHVNCIPDCGLLKSGALHRAAVSPALARVPRPQTGSNKPATAGQVRLATGSPPLGTAGYTLVNCPLYVCMYVCFPTAPTPTVKIFVFTRHPPTRLS